MKQHTPYSNFRQEAPKLENEYTEDEFLRDYLQVYMPQKEREEIEKDLIPFGKKVATELVEYANACEKNPPELISFNAWGDRVDEIKVAPEWDKLEKVAAEEGLVAIGYERKYGAFSRLYQFVKLYLYTPSSAIYSCPLAMSDGAARLIEKFGDDFLKEGPFKGLTTRNPEHFLTSGQWMTERTGGSDVSRSMTIAQETENGNFELKGHKWFTSAITADMAFTLASTEQPKNGKRAPLTLFYLPIRKKDGRLNGMKVEALKDKMGTKALPTAQMEITGAKARRVSEIGKGVRTISTLFNLTRIYNTITAVSYMRRAYSLSQKYSEIRETFGKKLEEHPLHQESLRKLEISYQSNGLLGFYLTRLLGKEECKEATDQEIALMRLLTPVAKLYTAKGAIRSASEEIEMFGGLGYLEDTNIPVLLRDAQVLSIWEGTTNVLSLDMLRAMQKDNVLPPLKEFLKATISKNKKEELRKECEILQRKSETLFQFIQQVKKEGNIERAARGIAFYIAELVIGVLWVDFLQETTKQKYFKAFSFWVNYKIQERELEKFEFLK